MELWQAPVTDLAEMRAESRLHRRFALKGFVALLLPNGRKRLWTYAMNMSTTGLLVRSWSPVEVGSHVKIQASKLPLVVGTARVQHCSRKGLTYRIGLEFSTPIFARF
jgi:hypothetical protein